MHRKFIPLLAASLLLALGSFIAFDREAVRTPESVQSPSEPRNTTTTIPHQDVSTPSVSDAEVPVPPAQEVTPAAIPTGNTESQPNVLRREIMELKPSLAVLAEQFQNKPFSEMDFPVYDGKSVTLTKIHLEKQSPSRGVFTAQVKGDTLGSTVVLSYSNDAVAGIIRSPESGTYYEIRNAPAAHQFYLTQVNPSAPILCGTEGHSH